MSKNFGYLAAAALGAVALLGATALPASAAQSGDTTATFTLDAGTLDIVVDATAALNDDAVGQPTITGDLGPVVVTDGRGGAVSWGMTAASTTFHRVAAPLVAVSTGVSYDSGDGTVVSGEVTPTTAGATSITAVAPVAAGTAVTGINTVSFNPTLTVTIPTSALAGAYTGTVTTSVA